MKTFILILALIVVGAVWATDPQQPSVGPTQVINATNGFGGILTVRTQINVGYPNQPGLIEISSTNGVYTVVLQVDDDGEATATSNPFDDYDIAAFSLVATNALVFGDLVHLFNGASRVFTMSADGTYYGRRLYLEDTPGSDYFTRIQPGSDITINAGPDTNKVVLDPSSQQYYIKQFGTNVFFIDPDSGSDGTTNLVFTAAGKFVPMSGGGGASVNPTIGRVPYNQDGSTFGDTAIRRQSISNIYVPNIVIGTVSNWFTGPVPYISGAIILGDGSGGNPYHNGIDLTAYTKDANAAPAPLFILSNDHVGPGGASSPDQSFSWGAYIENDVNSAGLSMTGIETDGSVAIVADSNSGGGSGVGLSATARGAPTNGIAIRAWSRSLRNGSTNLAIHAAIEPNPNNVQVGMLVEAYTPGNAGPPLENSMLMLDNRGTGYPLMVGRKSNGAVVLRYDDPGSAGAGETPFFLWDVSAATLKRVSVGASDSGGSGYKVLRVVN